jgi:hypothetical protein
VSGLVDRFKPCLERHPCDASDAKGGIEPENDATTTATLEDIVNTNQTAKIATDKERVEIGLAHAGFTRKHVVGSKNKTASTAKPELAAIPASAEVSKGLKG